MAVNTRLKVLSALVLAMALALPMSSCSYYVDPEGRPVGILGSGPPQADSREVNSYSYALESFRPETLSSWFLIASFLWPIPMLAIQLLRPRSMLSRVVWWLDPALAIASGGYIISVASIFSRPALGAYCACAALLAYTAMWVHELVYRLRGLGGKDEPNYPLQPPAGGRLGVN